MGATNNASRLQMKGFCSVFQGILGDVDILWVPPYFTENSGEIEKIGGRLMRGVRVQNQLEDSNWGSW